MPRVYSTDEEVAQMDPSLLTPSEVDYTVTEELGATFRRQNVFGSYFAYSSEPEPEYTDIHIQDHISGKYIGLNDAEERYADLMDVPSFVDEAINTKSPERMDWLARRARLEKNDMLIEQERGLVGGLLMDVGVGVTNIHEILIGGPAVSFAKTPLKMALNAGYSAVVGAGTTEIMLRETQAQRTLVETSGNVIGSGVLGGTIAGYVGRRELAKEAIPMAESDMQIAQKLTQSTDKKIEIERMETERLKAIENGEIEIASGIKSEMAVLQKEADDLEVEADVLESTAKDPDTVAPGRPADSRTPEQEVAIEEINARTDLSDSQKRIEAEKVMAEDDQLVNKTGILKWSQMGANLISAKVRTLMSDNPIANSFGNMIYNHGFVTQGNVKGKARMSVARRQEIAVQRTELQLTREYDRTFKDYAKETEGISKSKKHRHEFAQMVQEAMANGDKHEIKAVAEQARINRKMVDSVLKRGVKSGLYKEDVLTMRPLGDESWAPRGFSKNWVDTHSAREFVEALFEGALSRQKSAEADLNAKIKEMEVVEGRIADLEAEYLEMRGQKGAKYTRRRKEITEAVEKMRKDIETKAELEARRKTAIDSQADNGAAIKKRLEEAYYSVKDGDLNGGEFAGIPMRKTGDGETIHTTSARTLDIATKDIPRDMRAEDPHMMFQRSLQGMERQVILAETDGIGPDDLGLVKWQERVQQHGNDLIENAKTAKEKKKISKETAKLLTDIQNTAKMLNGVKLFDHTERTLNITSSVKIFNNVAKLGKVVMAAGPEVFTPIMTVGVGNFTRTIMSSLFDGNAFKQMHREMKADYAVGWESAASQRLSDSGLDDDVTSEVVKRIRQGGDFAVDKLFALGYWTRFARTAAGTMIQSQMGRVAMKNNDLTQQQIIDFARMGISADMIPKVRELTQAHGIRMRGGTVDMGLRNWEDKQLAEQVATAIRGESELVVLKPGLGDRPWMSEHAVGGMLLQYKSFMMASHGNIMMPGVQRMSMGDYRSLPAFAAMFMAVGAAQKLKHDLFVPEERQKEWGMAEFSRESLSMAGFMGLMMEYNTVLSGISGGAIDINTLLTGEVTELTKFQGARTIEGQIGGPAFGMAKDAIGAAFALGKLGRGGEMTDGDIRTFIRLAPLGNWYPTAMATKQWQDNMAGKGKFQIGQ